MAGCNLPTFLVFMPSTTYSRAAESRPARPRSKETHYGWVRGEIPLFFRRGIKQTQLRLQFLYPRRCLSNEEPSTVGRLCRSVPARCKF
jgi:hypothetical protein